jgi:catechol 2,3-dioxygenase-like lactoylglutathione lyase family enzyme
MSITQQSSGIASQATETQALDLKLEVVILPVTDADRAKQFYASLGWREDADFVISEQLRILQFTPPGSEASIIFGTGVTPSVPGPGGSVVLAVDDIDAARAELIGRGVDVSEVFHGQAFSATGEGREPGPDAERRSYSSFASFSDPDGNQYLLQEVTARLPGRVAEPDVAGLAALLLETAMQHHGYEQAAAAHDWWPWYAAYLNARQDGSNSEQANAAAGLYMQEEHGVAVPR